MPVVGGDGDVVYAVEKGGVKKKSIESFVVAVLGFKKKKKKKKTFLLKKKRAVESNHAF